MSFMIFIFIILGILMITLGLYGLDNFYKDWIAKVCLAAGIISLSGGLLSFGAELDNAYLLRKQKQSEETEEALSVIRAEAEIEFLTSDVMILSELEKNDYHSSFEIIVEDSLYHAFYSNNDSKVKFIKQP